MLWISIYVLPGTGKTLVMEVRERGGVELRPMGILLGDGSVLYTLFRVVVTL